MMVVDDGDGDDDDDDDDDDDITINTRDFYVNSDQKRSIYDD